jgi:hypothetical protein
MPVNLKRPYRKNLAMRGLIYLEGKEQEVIVRNISIKGVLVEINSQENNDVIFNTLLAAKVIDIYLPALRLAGEVDVVRVDMEHNHIILGLTFKNIAYDVDKLPCKRKAYRKNIAVAGQILLDGEYADFTTVNVSVEGLLIHLGGIRTIKNGTVTSINFEQLHLHGDAQVIWTDTVSEIGTLMGVHYISLKRTAKAPAFEHPIK